ncbi:MAG: aspartate aminotransferase family protein [Chloroflexi bacterium]|nr:aspartate aminotransferase family protein [Chloroflexota bacterium]
MDRTSTRQLTIEEEYVATHSRSQELHRRALDAIPSGVTHDSRFLAPFPIYGVRAQGSRKWDVDGNEYIDYVSGHGAIMLGHAHPDLVAAVTEQVARGTHLGLSTEHEVQWAELVKQLIPCAERVKFTSSGTEATSMAIRLARSYTGRSHFVKFQGHFHGWHDYATLGLAEPFDIPVSTGVPRDVADTVLVAPVNDIAAVEQFIDRGDVAAVILEPTGCHMGQVPIGHDFLQQLRELTARREVVLIFDEVVTGFRVSPGGAQRIAGVTPDLTTLAKILAGGLPGGAVCGKAEILGLLEHKPGDAQWGRYRRVAHPGTFNANPLSAAAGVAALKHIARGLVHEHTARMSDRLREGVRKAIRDRGVKGHIYGERSLVRIYLGISQAEWDALSPQAQLEPKGTVPKGLVQKAMYLNGVDVFGGQQFILSGAHTPDDIDQTVEALGEALERLQAEGAL